MLRQASMNISVAHARPMICLLDVFERLPASLQSQRRLGGEIRRRRHQQVLLTPAGGDREAVPGKIE
jgi:hypothetical protein